MFGRSIGVPKNSNDPLKFKPKRFWNTKWDYKEINLKYITFGSGRRICPEIQMGNKMLIHILASFLHSFNLRLSKVEEFELSEEIGYVTKKRKSIIAIPTQRLSDISL
ncbi:cytochrome P450 76C3-like [Rutidosis leptorrhynchoides]|uniref:cytochrome P450 76C3-like n=1 Tax=Rutidosis leptorrhynchoides TaxID=125765 RepID=UPI003A98DBF9